VQLRLTPNTHDHQYWRCVGKTASLSQIQQGIARRASSAAARPNSTGGYTKGQEDQAAHTWVEGSERAELETRENRIERNIGGKDSKEGGGPVFIVVEKSGEAQPSTLSLIGRPLNLGRQTAQLRLLFIISY
jgi:hypothetical protein